MPSVLTLSLLAASAQSSSQRIRYVFHEKGGVIGYGSSCNLVLPSPPETPPAELAEIKFEQSRFYVLGKRPDCVYLNEMQGPVHELPAPLKDGSVLLIHGYRFKVSVGQVEKQATKSSSKRLDQAAEKRDLSTLPDQWYADDFEVVSPTLKNTGQIFGTPVTLISSFLEGLGVTASPEEITPEIMKQVGGSLRVLLEHGKAEQEWLQKTQLSLCAHPEEVKASMSGMLSGELLQMSTSEILAILLNHREPLHAQFSKQLDSSCFFLRENLACLQQTTTNALLSVTEALSPKRAEAEFEQQSGTSISWSWLRAKAFKDFFQNSWSSRCDAFFKQIKQNFEARFLGNMAKRAQAKEY